jgi:hypothetical protein
MAELTLPDRVSRLEEILAGQVDDYKQGWVTIAQEGEEMTLPSGTAVRYGVAGHWLEKTVGPQEGQIQSTSELFKTDPAPNRRKYVQKKITQRSLPVQSGLSAAKFLRSREVAGRRRTVRTVRMKKGEYLREHHHLFKVLRNHTRRALKAELRAQKRELRERGLKG